MSSKRSRSSQDEEEDDDSHEAEPKPKYQRLTVAPVSPYAKVIKAVPKDWETLRGVCISHEHSLATILDLLHEEWLGYKKEHGFHCNRAQILHAFAVGTLYLVTDETVEDEGHPKSPIERALKAGAGTVPIRLQQRHYGCIPAFAVYDPKEPKDTILWVHSSYRGLGYGRWMADELELTEVWAIPEAWPFWTAIGFKLTGRDQHGCGAQMTRKYPPVDD
jgi:GNAT superfamily N-acetyltransferase